ncbi:MAG TPA: (2Fe-2S) ferredoxin domain-containing protein [Bacteroidales bacterium]|mgnify:CR=1 FL=1|nr:(2Fe-2S) ferredoxin domain-containing protein [Bacteroidales bacterium]
MEKVKTLDDLKKLKEQLKSTIELREKSNNPESHVQVKVAMATCGIASGAREIMSFFMDELRKRNIDAIVSQTGCMGYCYAEPTIELTIPGHEPVVYGNVTKAKADEIIEKHIKNGILVDGIIPVTYQNINKK